MNGFNRRKVILAAGIHRLAEIAITEKRLATDSGSMLSIMQQKTCSIEEIMSGVRIRAHDAVSQTHCAVACRSKQSDDVQQLQVKESLLSLDNQDKVTKVSQNSLCSCMQIEAE